MVVIVAVVSVEIYLSCHLSIKFGGLGQNHADRRATHNATERLRREHLNVHFQELAGYLPCSADTSRKLSKAQIVSKALDYIRYLLARSSKWEQTIRDLARENEQLLSTVNQLRATMSLSPLPNASPLNPDDLLRDDPSLVVYECTTATGPLTAAQNALRASMTPQFIVNPSTSTSSSISTMQAPAPLPRLIAFGTGKGCGAGSATTTTTTTATATTATTAATTSTTTTTAQPPTPAMTPSPLSSSLRKEPRRFSDSMRPPLQPLSPRIHSHLPLSTSSNAVAHSCPATSSLLSQAMLRQPAVLNTSTGVSSSFVGGNPASTLGGYPPIMSQRRSNSNHGGDQNYHHNDHNNLHNHHNHHNSNIKNKQPTDIPVFRQTGFVVAQPDVPSFTSMMMMPDDLNMAMAMDEEGDPSAIASLTANLNAGREDWMTMHAASVDEERMMSGGF